MRTVPSSPLVSPFAEQLLRRDLPRLPDERRRAVVSFACRRIDDLPSPIRLGVLAVAAVVRVLLVVPGAEPTVRLLAARPLPVVGEYVRLIRSLGYAYIWETWPATAADGRALDGAGA
jgi:hypothetical protein